MVLDGGCDEDKEFIVWNDEKLECEEGKDLCDCYECDINDTVEGNDIVAMAEATAAGSTSETWAISIRGLPKDAKAAAPVCSNVTSVQIPD